MARQSSRSKSASQRSRNAAPANSPGHSQGHSQGNPGAGSTGTSGASGASAALALGGGSPGDVASASQSVSGGISAGISGASLGAKGGAKGRAAVQRARVAPAAARAATPRREADTRERILKAGAELVGAKGFNGCGLSEILARAEVPKGSFYHYFASKEDFGVALIERARDEYLDSLREHLTDRRRSAVGRLRSIFEDTRNECARTGPTVECLIPKLALETATLSAPVHAAVKCSYEQWSALIAQVIREGQAAGEIDAAHDPDRLARVLVMLWEGAAVRMQIDRSIQPLDDFLAFVFDTLLRPETLAQTRAESRTQSRTRTGG